MNVRKRQLLAALLVVVVFGLPPLVTEAPLNDPFRADPVVLLVGDFRESAFGSVVKHGVDAALAQSRSPVRVDTIGVFEPPLEALLGNSSVATDFERALGQLRRDVIHHVAEDNVVAIIAANSSTSAPTVLAIGRTFHIPVLLTVATNDRLLSDAPGEVLRLVPADSRQAAVITDWAASITHSPRPATARSDTQARVAVLYDPRQYGADLVQRIRARAGNVTVLPFPLETTTETVGLVSYAKQAGVDGWVVVGYQSEAMDVYAKKLALHASGPLLLSDGAYGDWLSSIRDTSTLIAFPDAAGVLGDSSKSAILPGYAAYGHDALLLIADAIEQARSRHDNKAALMAQLRRSATDLSSVHGTLIARYNFSAEGDNTIARFHVNRANTLLIPTMAH